MIRSIAFCLALVPLSCSTPPPDLSIQHEQPEPKQAEPEPASLGTFALTFYWVADEADPDLEGPRSVSLFDPQCEVVARVSADFADAIRLEGTGRTQDGRLLNVEGACACPRSPCYFELDEDHPWGEGVKGRPLVPFRSVAVDPERIAIGTLLYVPALDGLQAAHDGCVVADDIGGAIEGAHLDWFVGTKAAYRGLVGDAPSRVEVFDGASRCRAADPSF